MPEASLVFDRDFVIGEVDPRLFGGFAEHIGRCVYGGLYEPDHPTADEDGFRTDVLALVRELDMPVTRYPGGNFVSGYNWEDGVGPRADRPRRLDLAWRSTETNAVGVNEFVAWCRKANSEPMLAVNLGTRGPDAARNLLEYCNHPGGSYWSDLRRAHGCADPHNIKLWCLGNEMDGPWQMGHKTAAEYGRVACETAKLMKMLEPSVELVVCGSSFRDMPTFAAWEAEVLEHTFDHVDYVSIHQYFQHKRDDTPGFLALPDAMGDFIDEVAATCDYVAAKRRSPKRMNLSFDEWNVWSQSDAPGTSPTPWQVAPSLVEQTYTMADALVVGGALITLLNRADRVKVGCLAQTVNVIAPIMTRKGGPAWRQTTFHPFAQASRWGRGVTLRAVVRSDRYDAPDREGVPYLKAAGVVDPDTGAFTLFAVNRALDGPLELRVDLRGFGPLTVAESSVLEHADLEAVNTAEQPEQVTPAQARGAVLDGRMLSASLEPASWNVIRLSPVTK